MTNLKGTKTANNLMHAFAGESQARNRYTYWASIAKKEGYVQIANIFEETANQEKEHAKRLMKLMNADLKGETLSVTGDFPVLMGTTLENLKAVLPVLEGVEDFTNDVLYETLMNFVKEAGIKNSQVLWPIRTAVSGKQMTPGGATEIMEIIGKEETLRRIRIGIEKLEAAI